MKTVWAFGDSYTFGHELSDCPGHQGKIPSRLTYSALIANTVGYEYQCNAMGYYANNAIARTIIHHINDIKKDDLVFVMWTYPIRREFLLEDAGFRTIAQIDDHQFAKSYIKYVDLNKYHMIKQSLLDIYTAQELLQHHKYLFLSADTTLQQSIIGQDSMCGPLVERIDITRWLLFDNNLGFHEWSEWLCNKKIIGHPQDQSHKALADKINQTIISRMLGA